MGAPRITGQTQERRHAFLDGTAFAPSGTHWERPEGQEGGGKYSIHEYCGRRVEQGALVLVAADLLN